MVTVPDLGHHHLMDDLTKRSIVSPRESVVPTTRVTKEPLPVALMTSMALLRIRMVFRMALSPAGPRHGADDDHLEFRG